MREGYVRSIEGDIDAAMLREFMESYKDPEAYAVAHVGVGAATALLLAHAVADGPGGDIRPGRARIRGQFPVLPGPNNEAGGPRKTPCHMDIPLRNCTVMLDDIVVVRDGKVIDEAIQ